MNNIPTFTDSEFVFFFVFFKYFQCDGVSFQKLFRKENKKKKKT